MMFYLLFAAAGLVLLTVAADHLVLGASRIAARMRISPVIVGVVVIGLGTSAPEFLVSGLAAARGDAGLALGNLTGSNILNLTLIIFCLRCRPQAGDLHSGLADQPIRSGRAPGVSDRGSHLDLSVRSSGHVEGLREYDHGGRRGGRRRMCRAGLGLRSCGDSRRGNRAARHGGVGHPPFASLAGLLDVDGKA
jgi:hypothetical protein